MRLLILTPHYPPRHGGTSDYTARLCDELAERGHSVTVVTKEGGPGSGNVHARAFGGPWTPRSFRRLHRIVRSSEPEAILVQYGPYSFNKRGPGLPVALLLCAVSLATNTPLFIYGHELYSPWKKSGLRAPLFLAQRMAIALLVGCSKSFVVTIRRRQRTLQRAMPWWRRKIKLNPVGPTLDLETADPSWRTEHGFAEETFLIAAMGVNDPSKGAHLLGTLAERVTTLGLDVRVVAIGGLHADHAMVETWGYVSSHDAWNLISAADLYVMPYEDGLSGRRTSALNGLAAGTALLTTSGPNTDSTLFSEACVAMAPAGDWEALFSHAVKLAGEPERLHALGARGKQLCKAQFSWITHIDRWEELLAQR